MTDVTLAWGDITTIRLLSGSPSVTEISDANLTAFLNSATKEINSKLITKVARERVSFIDDYRSNKIDGSNKTFFFKNWKTAYKQVVPIDLIQARIRYYTNVSNFNRRNYIFDDNISVNYIGDSNFDNEIKASDIRVVQYNPSTQTETDLTIASIDVPNCSFTLSTAPSNVEIYVNYAYMSIDPATPNYFLSQCVNYLASSYLFVGRDGFEYKFGNVTIKPGQSGGQGKQLKDKSDEMFSQLLINSQSSSQYSPMSVII